ncbi:hypothetical protein LZZ90_01180 [Flavobacterium sp. SM15]|uniref:hypothetical protein n=1 Tax=Flavobacterium sp. SM15 TaxID=2908005 RepID=UPI001EDAA6DB|nr:hypothetical protein [Flavobacterium sp. SM15]MCG2610114.1 hypothetical protein [Flavobacterium sp. SM15]
MRKIKLPFIFFVLIFAFTGFAQSKGDSLQVFNPLNQWINSNYRQIDFAIPLVYDPDSSEDSNLGSLLPAGANLNIGFGYQYKKLVGLGIHTGINAHWNEQLVSLPVYGNFRFSPKIQEHSALVFQVGYGEAFALGRGDLNGDYKKISLGYANTKDALFGSINIEFNELDFPIHDRERLRSFALGVTIVLFRPSKQ